MVGLPIYTWQIQKILLIYFHFRYINLILYFYKSKIMFKFKFFKFFFTITIFIIVTFLIINLTYTKFTQNVEVQADSTVANFALSVISKSGEIVKDTLKEDEELVYEFSIQNFSENISNDVKTKYNIILELSQENPPLDIELYKVKDGTEELLELENYTTKSPEIFNIGDKSADYKVKVHYSKTDESQELEENFNIKMKALCVQEEA